MNKKIFGFILVCVGFFALSSCNLNPGEPVLVINELMPSNKTTLLAADGKAHDWIEICNISDKEQSLKGYTLQKDSGSVKWDFPEKTLKPGECILVYASKKEVKGELSCGFKISSDGDSIQLVAPGGDVMSAVGYKNLKNDQSLKLTKKGKYKKTFYPTPGFANDDKGREDYFALLESQRKDPLKIWECCDKGKDKASASWVEVKNTSSQPVDMSSYSIICGKDSSAVLALPKQSLAPGAIVLVSDTKNQLKGHCVILMNGEKMADGINNAKTYLGSSIGRMQGKKGFFYFATPTPGAENAQEGFREVTDEPEFETKPGAYEQTSLIVKPDAKKKTTIYYTTDGSTPTLKSPVLKDSLKLTKTTIIRAIAMDSTKLVSHPTTATFILGVKHTLPVVCITMNEDDLYNHSYGIYADGPGGGGPFPHKGSNFWKKDWEKNAHVEFRDGKKGFSYDCGIKIFGGFSRALPKKSFNIKLHGRYGQSEVDYDLYNTGKKEKAESFVLRSGSQDATGVMVRDEYFTSLMAKNNPHIFVQKYRPVVVYINGGYFGIYYVREKVNADYVSNQLNVTEESVSLLMQQKGVLHGSNTDWIALVNYAIRNDTRDAEVFKYLKDRIHFESLIDFKLGEFFCSNTDVGNIRFFKSDDPRCDNKWHWIFYDLDATYACFKPLDFYIEGSSMSGSIGSVGPYNVLICRLLKNPEFRKLFLERWAYHRKNTFAAKNSQKVFDDLINTIKPEMQRNCQRWPQLSYEKWLDNVKKFREKIANRQATIDQEFETGIGMTAEEKKLYMPK